MMVRLKPSARLHGIQGKLCCTVEHLGHRVLVPCAEEGSQKAE